METRVGTVRGASSFFLSHSVDVHGGFVKRHLLSAIAHAGWQFAHLVTSESCRSYKPRPEMFLRGLEKLRCERTDVLHIGDSFASDVVGAQQLGIDTAWVNRKGRPLPDNTQEPTFTLANLRELHERIVTTTVPEPGVAAP